MTQQVFQHQNGFYWLDIVGPSVQELTELAKVHHLHPTSVQDCLDPEHLPKFEQIGLINFIIVRAADEEASPDGDTVQELTRKTAIFFSDHYMITIHRKDQKFIADLRNKWSAMHAVDSSILLSNLLCEFLTAVGNSYDQPISQTAKQLEMLEEKTFRAQPGSEIIEDGYYLKRRASVYKRLLRLSSDLVPKISQHSPDAKPYLQDIKENFDNLFFYADELLDNVNNLLTLYISLASQRTNEASHHVNEVMRVLTIFSVFFLPLNFVAGIYGMNFEHMPELKSVYGYPTVIIIMISIAVAIYAWFRKKNWL